MLLFIVVAVAVLAIDLVTKYVFVDSAFTLIPGVLDVIPAITNAGAAFGIFYGNTLFLIIFTIIIIDVGLFAYFMFRRKNKAQSNGKVFNIACGMILGGALGNLYDRVFLGHVRDFLKLDFIQFPIFNFADVFLNIGVGLLIFWMIFMFKTKDRENRNAN